MGVRGKFERSLKLTWNLEHGFVAVDWPNGSGESRNIFMERESERGSVFESSLKLYLECSACFCC